MNTMNTLLSAIRQTALVLSVLVSLGQASRLDDRRTVDDYLDTCLLGNYHKTKPGPESKLYRQCLPWKSRSCCTEEVSDNIHNQENYLNFDWGHCKDLSLQCRQHFIQDLCFYECEPNVGPWLVKDERKIRKERFVDVPLCESDCIQWWDACKDDFTCVENWAEHFNWSSGLNKCPEDRECRPFHQVFDGAHQFCENLFGPSFKVVKDAPGECFYRWFNEDEPNPNEVVARKKIAILLDDNESVVLKPQVPLILLVFLLLKIVAL